jgi:putative flippase GtrA
LNQHLRHEQGARRVRSTFPQAVVEHPSRAATVPHEGPAGRRGGARGSTARARKQRERLATLARFAAVGATGIVVNQLILWAWVAGAEHHYLLGAVVATQGSSTWNFCLTERWVFPGGGGRSLGSRYLMFLGINNSTLLLAGTDGLGVGGERARTSGQGRQPDEDESGSGCQGDERHQQFSHAILLRERNGRDRALDRQRGLGGGPHGRRGRAAGGGPGRHRRDAARDLVPDRELQHLRTRRFPRQV